MKNMSYINAITFFVVVVDSIYSWKGLLAYQVESIYPIVMCNESKYDVHPIQHQTLHIQDSGSKCKERAMALKGK